MTTLICLDATKCVLLNSFTLQKDDNKDFKIQRRDGNENIAEKVKLRSSSLYRNYSSPLPLSNVGEPSWSYPGAYPYPSAERETKFGYFHVVVVQKRAKNAAQKDVMHVQSCCFAY